MKLQFLVQKQPGVRIKSVKNGDCSSSVHSTFDSTQVKIDPFIIVKIFEVAKIELSIGFKDKTAVKIVLQKNQIIGRIVNNRDQQRGLVFLVKLIDDFALGLVFEVLSGQNSMS
jgi:hypothetical protein